LSVKADSKATTSGRPGVLISKAIKSPTGGGGVGDPLSLLKLGIVLVLLFDKGILK